MFYLWFLFCWNCCYNYPNLMKTNRRLTWNQSTVHHVLFYAAPCRWQQISKIQHWRPKTLLRDSSVVLLSLLTLQHKHRRANTRLLLDIEHTQRDVFDSGFYYTEELQYYSSDVNSAFISVMFVVLCSAVCNSATIHLLPFSSAFPHPPLSLHQSSPLSL